MELRLDLDEEEERNLSQTFISPQPTNHKPVQIKQAEQPRPPVVQPIIDVDKLPDTKQNATTTVGMDRQVKFSSLCDLFEKSLEKTHNERLQLLQKLWKSLSGNDYYPFMRLLLPQLDKERMTYGLKESKIAKYLIEILCIKQNSEDALRLKKWKDPSLSKGQDGNSFSDTVYSVLKKRGWGNKTDGKRALSIYDVNKLLDALCATNDVNTKKKHLMQLLTHSSALELKWLIRIIVKDMRYGMQHTSILKEFHPNAMDVWNSCTDLREVTRKCLDPKFKFSTAQIEVFSVFKPMLASLANPEKLPSMLTANSLVVEPKYDGERIAIHKQGDQIKFFTRNSKDYTNLYGPKFNHVINKYVKAKHCILDGEMLVWNKDLGGFKEFGHNRTFALSDGSNTQENFCYMIFDVLHVNGKDIFAEPLRKRRKYLEKIIAVEPHVIEIVPQSPVISTSEIYEALDAAILNRDEGIIIKNTESTYNPGERKSNWIKLKPDHVDGMGETVDLIIMGGYYGTKFNRKSVSHFLLGVSVRDPSGGLPKVFHTCCKVGSGYTSSELLELQKQLEPHWIRYDKTRNRLPDFFAGWEPQAGEIPDVYIEPENSKIIEVKAYSINETVKFRTGQTLRFPRVKRIRDDKEWHDCLDLEQLKELIECTKADRPQQRKTATQLLSTHGHVPTVRGVKRKAREDKEDTLASGDESGVSRASKRRKVTVVGHYADTDTGNIRVETSLFKGKEFVVLSGSVEHTKDKLECMIVQHGGTKVQNPSEKTAYIIAHDTTLKVNNLMDAARLGKSPYGDKDIIHVSWLIDSIREGGIVSFHPRYMLYTSKVTDLKFKDEMDKYLDSFAERASRMSLQKSFEKVIEIEGKNIIPLTQPQIKVVNEKYGFVESVALKHTFMRPVTAMFVECPSDELNSLYLTLYGGKVLNGPQSDQDLKTITHLIYNDNANVKEEEVLRSVKKKDAQVEKIIKMKTAKRVKLKWLMACVKQKKLVDITEDLQVK